MSEEILALVAVRSGMVFAPNRRLEAQAGIARAMRAAGAPDVAAYLASLRQDAGALDDLVDEVTVGETHFMRDPAQMDQIRREVLPALKARRDGHPRPRVWSAGCATGEEAYSLAILLAEEGLGEDAFVLGTDLSAAALARARAASYSDWSMRGVSSTFLEYYFRHERKRRVLVDRIRAKVRFERLNLVGAEEYAAVGAFGMDLILCRNVLIYFDHATVARIAARLFACLAEGGVLLTAGADPLLGEYAPFDVEVTRVGLVYRRPRAGSVPTAPARILPAPRPPPTEAAPLPSPSSSPSLPTPDQGRDAFDRTMALANTDGAEAAEPLARRELRHHPLSAPLRYLHATLLLSLERDEEAEQAAQRALYLDRTLAVAHFLLGTILRRRGARSEALRAFRNTRDLCAGRPPDEEVRAGLGERMGALRSAAAMEIERLEGTVA
jgi:chemotaxis protein methyltransferase CheR